MTITQSIAPHLAHVAVPAEGVPRADTASVLHLINGEHFAGAERVQDLLAQRLGDYGFRCSFACLKPDRFEKMRASTVPIYNLPMRGRAGLQAALRLARLLKTEGFQLLHTHTPRTALIGGLASQMTGVPMVHHFHGQTASEMTRHLFGRVSAATERWSVRQAQRIIAVSPSVRAHWIEQGTPADRLVVVPNGVTAPQRIRRTQPGDNVTWTIATVAFIRPRKGLEVLLGAFAKLVEQQLNVRLRVIGPFESNQYEAELRERARQLHIDHQVDWVGPSSDVYSELAHCDTLVLPSVLPEGLPMVVLEGMACGVPVVATRVDGTMDVVQHERNGLLAEPGDPESLAEQLRRLVTRQVDWKKLRDAAQADYLSSYSDHSMAQGVAEVYGQVLGDRPLADTPQ